MSVLAECPHCETRVLPLPGRICPACRRHVDTPPGPGPTAAEVSRAVLFAEAQVRRGVDPARIATTLADRGVDRAVAAAVVAEVTRSDANPALRAGRRNMLIGALWCGGGVALTVATYSVAAEGQGGKFIVAWGAIFGGAYQFLRGAAQSAVPR